jgi:Skp family chaperone for outer membrane proteins
VKRIAFLVAGVTVVAAASAGTWLWAQQPPTGGPEAAAVQAPPQTRLAFVNIARVFQEYEKAMTFKRENDKALEPSKLKGEQLAKEVVQWKTDLESGKVKPEDVARYQYGIKKNTRDLEDLQAQIKAWATERNDKQFVEVYKDLVNHVQRYSLTNNYQIILGCIEPPVEDAGKINNIMRKVHGMDMGGGISALYIHPGLDVTTDVIGNMNQAYRATNPNPVIGTPTGLPKS